MRRISLCFMALVLLALPALAQPPSVPACGAAKAFPLKGMEGTLAYKPLQPEERLFYGLAGLGQESPLEVRYMAGGKPYLTEIVDLATSTLPERPSERPKAPMKSRTALDSQGLLLDGERMVELLAVRPDLVRQLHQLARKNDAPIEIEVHQEGRQLESLTFQELTERSAELRKGERVPLVVQSTVGGPGDTGGEKIRSAVAFDYLPSCGDCTTETPCETECGYDPGKGGPVTCGEYGICNYVPSCACSSVVSEYWTGWYVYNTYYDAQACLRSFTVNPPQGAIHYRYVQVSRRDRIRRTYVCPNCPSCTNCYYQEQVISYQLSYATCWDEGAQICYPASMPSCSSLCFAGPFTPCY